MTQPQEVGSAKGRSLVDIRAELKKQSDEIASRIGKPGGDFIKVQTDKSFKLPDGTVDKGPLSVVILDFISGNFYYDRPYKEGEMVPPACFAIGPEPDALIPHASSPVKQHADCKGCANNVFGTNGAGKACTNTRVLAVTAPGPDDAPIYYLKVSPTAVRAWDAYVKSIKAQFATLPIGVVTDIYFDESLKYASLRFGNPQENEHLAKHYDMIQVARERLLTAPDVSQYQPPKGAKKK